MDQTSLDRNVLFGILAMQVDLIDAAQLAAGMATWAAETTRPLGEILVEQGAMTATVRDALEPMNAAHVERHGGDPARSLAGLSSTERVRAAIDRVAGAAPGLRAGLSRLVEETLGPSADLESTIDFRGGRATADRPDAASGRFRVLRPHARGGLGQVYVARDNELGREVALKEILADKANNPVLRARFVLEAEINGNLEHPGIVPVYGLGTHPDGRPFYAMRFIEGDSLKEAIERFHRDRQAGEAGSRRPFDSIEFRRLLRRFVDVCNAIAYAHSRGVLHRDLKPSNIMLGQYGETLIIDWGLAKATGRADPGVGGPGGTALLPASGSSVEQTEAGIAMGTPAFMSPEQADGRIEQLGPASDLYGLGATLFAVLTGRPPVDGGNVAEVLVRVRSGAIDPPRSIAPGLPRPLEAIALKALALRPEGRYPRAEALADDVERWLADEPVSADREPWADRLRRWGRRNRTAVATAATAGLVALAGLGVVAAVQTQGRRQLAIKNGELTAANLARGRALDKANTRVDLALQALGRFREAVDANLDVQNRPENAPLRNELLQTPLAFFRTLGDDLRDDPSARPEDRLKLADSQLELAKLTRDVGNQAAALGAADEAVATLEALEDGPGEARGKLMAALGLVSALQADNGRREEARKSLGRGVALGEALVAEGADVETRVVLARLLAGTATAEAEADRNAAALATLGRAGSLLDGVVAAPDQAPAVLRLRANLLYQAADLQADSGNHKGAIETFRSAILLLRPLVEGPRPDWEASSLLSTARLQVGQSLVALGRATEAMEDYRGALEVRRAMSKERPANLDNRLRLVSCLRRIALAQGDLGRDEAALGDLREARGLLESARLENPRNVRVLKRLSEVLSSTGGSLYGLGRVEESLASFEEIVPIREELARIEPGVTTNRTDLAGNLYNVAVLRKTLGRFETSLQADLAALAIRRRLAAEFPDLPNYRLQVAASLGNIGGTYIKWKNDGATALAYYSEESSVLAGLARAHPDVVEYSEYLSRSRTNFASVLSMLGRFEAALAVGRDAGPYLEGRVRAEPGLVLARLDLAFNLGQQAESHLRLRHYEEADRLERRALESLLAIPEAGRAGPEAVQLLANRFGGLGISAAYRGRLEEAVEHFGRSISAAQPDPKITPTDGSARGSLRTALEGRAEAHARLGRLDEARADWSRLATVREPGEPDPSPLGPILIRAWSGDPAGFLADAEAAVAASAVKKDGLVTLARAASAAIPGARPNSALADRLGDAALAWLLSARAEGAFAGQGDWKDLTDPRFDPVAQRPEFRDLLADLTFPADPFAPETAAP